MKNVSKKAYTTLTLIFIAYIICFIDRSAMNIALAYVGKDFHLNPAALGGVASAFFFSYSLMQIPGGWLADKVGSKKMVIFSLIMWSFFTIMTGFAWSIASLLVIRVLFGIGEGGFPTASLKQIAEEFPKETRSQATTVTISSNYVGSALAPVIIAPIIAYTGWRNAFHIMGIIGLTFVVIYFLFERPIAQKKQVKATDSKKEKFSWKAVDPRIWSFFFIIFGLNIITKGLDTWMPTYLLTARKINLAGIAWLVPLPSIAAGVGAFISGFIMVKFFKNKERWLISSMAALTMIFMYGMYASKSLAFIIVFEVLAYFVKSIAFSASFGFIAQIISQKAYGSSIGIVNFGGQAAGFIAPMIIGWVVATTGGSYASAFLFLVGSAAMAFIATLTIRNRKTA
ncbi:MFS transporter [Ligilactobacillus equi]|uniref:MFS transporter n=1 Tax=Ligilactobacillus equi TaxID=137357 RepID=UPI002ED57370